MNGYSSSRQMVFVVSRAAATIPWHEIEDRYAGLFPSKTGMPAKPLQAALGSLIIQKQYDYSDRELVEQICENPYYQCFIGLPGYQDKQPFVPSLLVGFRKRLTPEILDESGFTRLERISFDAPAFDTALKDFLEFAGDMILVGHNIHAFDMKFISRYLKDSVRRWEKCRKNPIRSENVPYAGAH